MKERYNPPEACRIGLETEASVCTSTEQSMGSSINPVTEEERNDWI